MRATRLQDSATQPTELETRLTRALEPRREILDAYLFGSHARGEAGALSDIDVAVHVDDQLAADSPYGYEADLIAHLMGELGTNAIDVVVLNRAPPLLYYHVLRGRLLLSRDPRATTTRAGYARSRYFDWVPQMEKMDAARSYAAKGRA